jgi:glutamine synthetase
MPPLTPTWPSPPCSVPGIDGIKNQIDPGDPLDVDIYDLSPEELAKIPSTPGSCWMP